MNIIEYTCIKHVLLPLHSLQHLYIYINVRVGHKCISNLYLQPYLQSEASTRRGGSNERREWRTAKLSINITSPFFQGMATHSSSRIFKQSWMISAGNSWPSPNVTAFTGSFLASFHPVYAATMLLNQILRCLDLSYLMAGIGPITVFTPLPSHSSFIPSFAALQQVL